MPFQKTRLSVIAVTLFALPLSLFAVAEESLEMLVVTATDDVEEATELPDMTVTGEAEEPQYHLNGYNRVLDSDVPVGDRLPGTGRGLFARLNFRW